LEVWPAKHIDAMARRDYDTTDRDLLSADLARRRAHEISEIEIQITDYNQKLLTNSKDTESLGARGVAYLQKADYAHAVADFNALISLQPDTALWWNDRCYARVLENRDIRKAISDCDKSLQLEPNNAYTLDSRGHAYLRLGELDKSIADFNAALKVDPQLASALYGRGLAKRKKGDVGGGNTDIAEAKKINANIVEEFAIHGIK
jgi:tetratricopeptide (TPR) repeat protein